jgi:catechol 2,3-dioxygenase-like lactoylglutathione lyase family enzyme
MLNSINISHIFVFDQDKALDFYVGKLGLEVSNDLDLGVMRWLTVRVPGDPTRDILLELPGPPSMDPKTAEAVRETISKGASGFAAGFTTSDAKKTYEEYKKRGVEIALPLLAGLHEPAQEWRDANRIATYDLIREKQGADAALAWIREAIPDRPKGFVLTLYQMRKYDLLSFPHHRD